MKTFIDNSGKTWVLNINIETIKRVRTILDTDLLDFVKGDLIKDLYDDPCKLVDVIYVICKDEADSKGISDVDFGKAMAGDSLDLATDALFQEMVDFFPKGKKQILQKALAKMKTMEEKAINLAMIKLESKELEDQMEAILQQQK